MIVMKTQLLLITTVLAIKECGHVYTVMKMEVHCYRHGGAMHNREYCLLGVKLHKGPLYSDDFCFSP